MTNNEHNEQVLTKISKLMAEISSLKETLKPADSEPYVDLTVCNAGALEARQRKFATNAKIKSAVEQAVSTVELTRPKKKAVKDV